MKTNLTPILTVDPEIDAALWARFVAPVLDGSEGFVHQLAAPGVDDPTRLLPLGSIEVDVTTPHARHVLARTKTWTALVWLWTGRPAVVWLRASGPEQLAKAVAEVRGNIPAVDDPPEQVTIDFWQVAHGAHATNRSIEAPSWKPIADHYRPTYVPASNS